MLPCAAGVFIKSEYINEMTYYTLYALKTDGNVYSYYVTNSEIIKNNGIVFNKDEYGKIKYFYYSASSDKKIENIIIYSENGLYTLEDIKTEECTKYEDIKCQKEILLNDKLKEYKDEIIYFDKNIIIDKNKKFYQNDFIEIEYIP